MTVVLGKDQIQVVPQFTGLETIFELPDTMLAENRDGRRVNLQRSSATPRLCGALDDALALYAPHAVGDIDDTSVEIDFRPMKAHQLARAGAGIKGRPHQR